MCGIVGYIGENQAVPVLLNGLSKLEYRGYDSAGVALALEDQFSSTNDEADLPGIATFQDVVAYIRAHT